MSVFWSDTRQPRSFTDPNGREWAFLETAPNLFDQLNKIKQKFHCNYELISGLIDGEEQVYRVEFNCNSGDPICTFALMAGKTEGGRFHLYASGQHTCGRKDDAFDEVPLTTTATEAQGKGHQEEDGDGVTMKPLTKGNRQEEKKPAEGDGDGRDEMEEVADVEKEEKYTVEEGIEKEEKEMEGSKDDKKYEENKKEEKRIGGLEDEESEEEDIISDEEMEQAKDEEETVQGKEDEDNSDKEDESVLRKRAPWPDEQVPFHSVQMTNGRQWTFLGTTAAGMGWASLHAKIKREYQCYRLSKKTPVCRATLCCTAGFVNCEFQMLVHRTNRDRYHIYTSGVHTCKHKGKEVTMKSLIKRSEEKEGQKEGKDDEGEDAQMEEGQNDDKEDLGEEEAEEEEQEEEGYVNEEKEQLEDEEMEQEEEDIVQRKRKGTASLWSDANPPVKFTTTTKKGLRKWTYAETTIEIAGGKAFIELLLEQHLKPTYRCYLPNKKLLAKRQYINRVTLPCTTAGNIKRNKNNCAFALLAQLTDQNRYHLYTWDKHTCRHANKEDDDKIGEKKRKNGKQQPMVAIKDHSYCTKAVKNEEPSEFDTLLEDEDEAPANYKRKLRPQLKLGKRGNNKRAVPSIKRRRKDRTTKQPQLKQINRQKVRWSEVQPSVQRLLHADRK